MKLLKQFSWKQFFAKNFDSKYLMLAVLHFPDRKPRLRFSRSKDIQWQFNFWIGKWVFVARLGPFRWKFTKKMDLSRVVIEPMNEYSGHHYYFRGRGSEKN